MTLGLGRGTPFPVDHDLPHPEAAAAARARQDRLTKPRYGLGRLEDLAIRLAGLQGTERPQSRPAACLIFAADHPVTRHGVSAYPSAVTRAMVDNMITGGAAASVLCRQLSIPLRVLDVGVDGSPDTPDSGDLRVEDAMSPDAFRRCWEAGAQAFLDLHPRPKVLILGEMGIGNTTAASAVAAALLALPPDPLVGPGTGLDPTGRARKVQVVQDALRRLGPEEAPLEVLRRVGGRELVAMAGAAEAAVDQGSVILVDGFIASAALLALVRHQPAVAPYLICAHRSREPGHAPVVRALGGDRWAPLLDLDLALGEGSGALLALPLLDLATALHEQMATFESAQVPGRSG